MSTQRTLSSLNAPSLSPRPSLRRRLNDGQVGLSVSFALVMLAAVVVIGLVLGLSFRSETSLRGLAEGRSEALLMAQTAVGPQLDGRSLSYGLSPKENVAMERLVATSIKSGHVLRLRLRDLAGTIVFASDDDGLHDSATKDDAEEIESAASGEVVGRLTTLNADDPTGPRGPAAVEVYLPLDAGIPSHRVGVLEVYLPYAPIRSAVNAGLARLYRYLAMGLGLLYVVLFGIAYVVGRRLRRQVKITRYVGEHDALTDLPNRLLFRAQGETELRRARRRGESTAIAVVDLDRFKEINDTLGHDNGDLLLASLSATMRAKLPAGSSLARLGGDEFGFVLPANAGTESLLEGLRRAVATEVLIDGIPLSIESSIGYAVSSEEGESLDELLRLAEIAMYFAKQNHQGVARYHETQNNFVASDLALMADLRLAIVNDELTLHYQPQISLRSGEVESVEALVRWNHPSEGLLYPDRFIGLAEKTDLIDRVTEWVIREALSHAEALRSRSRGLRVSVNISARNLSKDGFAPSVVRALATSGVAPERLVLEVTETALMTDPPRAARSLEALGAAGVRLSIDDFGVGQTSLSFLSSLPVTELKIDRSFITDMRHDESHEAIVRAIVDLGHNLGFRVVGEGVEDAEVWDALSTLGCDVAQGYYFARPMNLAALGEWFDARDAALLVR